MDRPLPNIRHLAAFVATAKFGSVTRAARQVNLTQPALTQAIARLERTLGCALFERSAEGMRATEPADLLVPRAEAALALIGSRRITATQMHAFLALAKAGSYAGAAQASGLSAASLHRAVADLAVALGQRLVEKQGRHVTLSRAGLRRARAFSLARAELLAGLDEVARWQGKAAGRVVVGAMPLSRARWLPEAVLAFAREFPDVDVRVIEGSHAELSAPLRDGVVDMMLGALRGDGDDLAEEAVFVDRPQIVARAGHPALLGGVSPDALATYPWVLPGEETPLRRYWEDMMQACGLEPPAVRITCGSILTARQLLLGSDMLTMASADQLRVELDGGLLAACAPPVAVARTIGITTRRDWHPTAPQRRLVGILRATGHDYDS